MKRPLSSRVIAARARYLEDRALFGLARADELAHARQAEALDLLRLAAAEELS